MHGVLPPLLNLPWSLWKAGWRETLATATVAAGLEAGTFALFLYMFFQDPHRLFAVADGGFLVFWCFHVGVLALHAYLPRVPGSRSNTNKDVSDITRDFKAGAILILTVTSADGDSRDTAIGPGGCPLRHLGVDHFLNLLR